MQKSPSVFIKNAEAFLLIWSVIEDSNLWPSGPKPDALPGCANHRKLFTIYLIYIKLASYAKNLVGDRGFEPLTLWSQTRCATGLR